MTARLPRPDLNPRAEIARLGQTGVVYTISRLLDGSALSLVAGTHSNLSLAGASINAAVAIAPGASQTAVVREVLGLTAIEYSIVISGPVLAASNPALIFQRTTFFATPFFGAAA